MTNKNAAPERIELSGGWHFRLKTKAQTEHQWDIFFLCTPEGEPIVSSVFTRTVAEEFAAAMQPVPSESDEAVAREIVQLNDTWVGGGSVEDIAAILAKHRQPAAHPVPHVEVSKTAEALADDIVNKHVSAGFVATKAIRFEISQNIQTALDSHAIRVGELVRDASAKTAGKSPGNNSAAANIRALDIATILKGDK